MPGMHPRGHEPSLKIPRRVASLRWTTESKISSKREVSSKMSARLAVLHSHVAGKSGAPARPPTLAEAAAASAGTIERVEYGVLFGERPHAAGLADLFLIRDGRFKELT